MTFVHPWHCCWLSRRWPGWPTRGNTLPAQLTLLTKGLSLAAIAIALAEPVLTLPRTRVGAVVLVDTSKSITQEDLTHASSLVTEIERHSAGNWLKIVPFASRTRELTPEESVRGLRTVADANGFGDSTNFETALTHSMAAIPNGYIPRLILISDGNENQGSTARAIAELQRLQVPVDTIPLSGR